MKPNRARSDELVDSLHDLCALSDLRRAELYWNIQRLGKTRRRIAAITADLARHRQLRVFRQPPTDLWIHQNPPPHAA